MGYSYIQEDEEETKQMFNLAPLLFAEATIPPNDICYVKLSVINEHVFYCRILSWCK